MSAARHAAILQQLLVARRTHIGRPAAAPQPLCRRESEKALSSREAAAGEAAIAGRCYRSSLARGVHAASRTLAGGLLVGLRQGWAREQLGSATEEASRRHHALTPACLLHSMLPRAGLSHLRYRHDFQGGRAPAARTGHHPAGCHLAWPEEAVRARPGLSC